MFNDPFSFYGRIRRTEFALTFIIYFIILFVVAVASQSPGLEWVVVVLLLPIYMLLTQGIKRCHDLGRSGWWLLVPFYAFVMFFGPGDYGENEYGENPKGEGNEVHQDPFGYDFKTTKINPKPTHSGGFSFNKKD